MKRNVLTLGTAQTLAWASSYYLPALLAAPQARELGLGTPWVFAAFSLALVVSAAVGPWAGRAVDRQGGRGVLMTSNLLFALGLLALASVQNALGLFAAWALIGLAMGCGLYETAFAALVRLRGVEARSAITGITLIAGFASTLGWPLTAWLEAQWGWRGACMAWAALHLLLGLPLNALLPRAQAPARLAPAHPGPTPAGAPDSRTLLLSAVFAALAFTTTAMATHLPTLLQASGASAAAALGVAALVGPAQVAGRLAEFGLLRHVHPLWAARVAALGHPLGVGALLLGAPVSPLFAPLFALLHGAGTGIMTIAKGTLPLVLFGAQGYGARQGWLMLPARATAAATPWLFGLLLAQSARAALVCSALLGLLASAVLLGLKARR